MHSFLRDAAFRFARNGRARAIGPRPGCSENRYDEHRSCAMTGEDREKSFEELLKESEMNVGAELQVGDRVRGPIIKVGRDLVYVDTGTKTDGVVEKEELEDEEGRLTLQEGDTVELFVVSREGSEIRLARSLGAGGGGLEHLQQAMQRSIPVEGKVKQTCKGGFRVRLMGRTGFCPMSQIDIRPVQDPEIFVGESFRFLISRIEESGRNIVVSRRELLEREQAEALESFAQSVSPGDILQGTVSRLAPYGAFVRVEPGIEGLVHVSEMSWSRNVSPEEIAAPGDAVSVKLLSLEDQGRGKVRMELSMKQTRADPWQDAATRYEPGTVVEGTVTRTAPFGAFVEVEPGIEGLVHVSEISYLKRVNKPDEEVSPGDRVQVAVKGVDPESRRMSLSMREARGDPWEGVAERYAAGQVVEGRVEKREDFGLLVQLEPGVVGLVPASMLNASPEASLDRKKPGDPVSVSIESVDPEKRRITLAPSDSRISSEERQAYAGRDQELGSLGEKLQQALRRKHRSS
jgi:small subunit ribosomal protein S1